MPWIEVFWTPETIEHLAEHGISVDDAEHVLRTASVTDTSRTSGRPIKIGRALDGRRIAVVYERVDKVTVHPITAFEM